RRGRRLARHPAQRCDRGQSRGARHPSVGARSALMQDLLRVEDLRVRFATPGGHLDAVRGISFRLRPASTVALVGESGSGKSVVSQSILRILPRNGQIAQGSILFADPRAPDEAAVDLTKLPADGPAIRAIRGGQISIIFQ